MGGLSLDDVQRATRIVEERGEPLPIETLARRFFEDEEERAVLGYSPDHSFLVGERVAWETRSYGRLIGEITAVEHADGRWRMLIDWDDRLSPGLGRYREARQGIRLAYVMDPTADRPAIVDQSTGERGDSIGDLLARDLEDDLRAVAEFVEWAGLWAPTTLLPQIDPAAFDAAAEKAIQDDGVAHTNEVIGLLRLAGPNEHGHGFAALAVNLRMRSKPAWIWGGPREGGQWLPRRRVDAVRATIGHAPRFEELVISAIPQLADEELPDALAELVAHATIRGLDVAEISQPLRHIVSDWEREHAVLAFDEHEFAFFPPQATVRLLIDSSEHEAMLLREERLLSPLDSSPRESISGAAAMTLARIGASDVFSVIAVPVETALPEPADFDLLRAIVDVFTDGRPHRAEDVVEAILERRPGDLAVVARTVAAVLVGYQCFATAPDEEWLYRADLPHAPRAGPTTTVATVARRSFRAREEAIHEERAIRRWRADSIRSPHMVRGHFRRLRKSVNANPIQVALARRYGMAVPRGHTFVRPHERH